MCCARVAVIKDIHIRKFYERVKRRRGEKKATLAVAWKLVSYAYWMLKRNITYDRFHHWKLLWGHPQVVNRECAL
jgi:hypothetical protein